MKNIELTLLEEKQIIDGSNRQLDIFKNKSPIGIATDFAILTGADVNVDYSCCYYLKTSDGDGEVEIVNGYGNICADYHYLRNYAIRPVIILNNKLREIILNSERGYYGGHKVLFGEYPQNIVSEEENKILEQKYWNIQLQKSNGYYTVDLVETYMTPIGFHPQKVLEYIYNGKKYIRVENNNINKILLDSRDIKKGETYWLKVTPVTWLIDEKKNYLISEKCLLGGIQFESINKRYDDNFEETEIYHYMNAYMAKEMFRDSDLLIDTKESNEVNKPINYPSINERIQEIKKRVKKLQERR